MCSRGLFCALFALLLVPQASENRKDIPVLTREAVKAVVLVVASDKTGREIRQGSGFLISRDGKVVTNYHVVAGADSAVIKFPSGAFYLIEGVLAVDQQRDIAILKAAGKDFSFLSLGDSDQVQIGEEVLAIGSPLALEATVSNGIVSSIRELEQASLKVIQTTAPISPGSSGGALLNLRGEAIGITTFQSARGQNLNFAIPVNYIKPLLAAERTSPLGQDSDHTKSTLVSSRMPEVWTSLTSGRDYKIRVEGDYIYTEWLLPESLRNSAAFLRCELKREESRWVGKCRSNLPYTCSSTWYGAYTNWCLLGGQLIITSMSPRRIEGEGDGWEPKDFDCGKCRVKKVTRKSFVWIPKE